MISKYIHIYRPSLLQLIAQNNISCAYNQLIQCDITESVLNIASLALLFCSLVARCARALANPFVCYHATAARDQFAKAIRSGNQTSYFIDVFLIVRRLGVMDASKLLCDFEIRSV